jgi:hypothetical protein
LLCSVLRVTRKGYYAWRRREAAPGPSNLSAPELLDLRLARW